jgi:hypothetical protein
MIIGNKQSCPHGAANKVLLGYMIENVDIFKT